MSSPIYTLKDLSPEWLMTLLKKHGLIAPDQAVIWTITELQRSSRTIFWDVELKVDADSSPKQSKNHMMSRLLIKDFHPEFPSARKLKPAMEKELLFYTTFGTKMTHLPIPHCLYTGYQPDPFNGILIFLAISPAPHQHIPTHSNNQIYAALDTLAQIHAYWWDSPSLGNEIPAYPDNPNIVLRDHIMATSSREEFESYFSRVSGILYAWLNSNLSSLTSLEQQAYQKGIALYPSLLWERLVSDRNLTLIHGDAHPHQFLYPPTHSQGPEPSSPILGDWEAWRIGIGPFDLAYYFGLFPLGDNLTTSDLHRYLAFYHRSLQKYGIQTYTWDQCFADFRLGLLDNLFIPIWNNNRRMFQARAIAMCRKFHWLE